MNRKILELSDRKLKKIARDKRNIVYKYGEREALPAAEIVPLDNVRDKVKRLYTDYCRERKIYIDQKRAITHEIWVSIKEKLLMETEWKQFDHTHPLIVDRILHPSTTPKDIKAIIFMIWLKAQPNADMEILKQYIFNEFSMTLEEYEKQKCNQ